MSANTGVLVLGPIRPFDSTDTYPTCLSDEMLGGLHVGANLTALQAIPSLRLSAGMLGFTDDSNTLYKLGGDLATWTSLSVIGSGLSGSLSVGKISYCSNATGPVLSDTNIFYDGINVGIGTTNPLVNLQIGSRNGLFNIGNNTELSNNLYYNSGWKYLTSSYGSALEQDGSGNFFFYTAPNGTSGNPATLTTAMSILLNGSVGIGYAAPLSALCVNGGMNIGGQESVSGLRLTSSAGTSYTDIYSDGGNNLNIALAPSSGTSYPSSINFLHGTSKVFSIIDQTPYGTSFLPRSINVFYDDTHYGSLSVDISGNLLLSAIGTINSMKNFNIYHDSNDSVSGYLNFYKDKGSFTNPADVTYNNNVGIISFGGYFGGAYRTVASMRVSVGDTPAGTYVPGLVTFASSTLLSGPRTVYQIDKYADFIFNTAIVAGSTLTSISNGGAIDFECNNYNTLTWTNTTPSSDLDVTITGTPIDGMIIFIHSFNQNDCVKITIGGNWIQGCCGYNQRSAILKYANSQWVMVSNFLGAT